MKTLRVNRARYPITYIRTRILHTYYPTHMLRRYAVTGISDKKARA